MRTRYGNTRVVSVLKVKAAEKNGVDLLAIESGACAADLVRRIVEDGKRGESFPNIDRAALRWEDGGEDEMPHLIDCDPVLAEEWHIRAWCVVDA